MRHFKKCTPLYFGMGALALSSALVPMTAFAATETQLDDVVVSANRTATSIKKVGSSVTVITAEDIQAKQAQTVQDAIRDVPGVTINSRGEGQTSEVYIRGYPSKNIVVLIDGVNISDPTASSSTFNLSTLSTANIDRIEVLRGTQSTLYGADASAGVISITTKSGKGSEDMFGGSASVEIGSFTTRRENLSLYGRTGNVYYSSSAMIVDARGMDTSRKIDSDENDPIRTRHFDLKVGADLLQDVGILDKLNVEALFRSSDSITDTDTAKSSAATYLLDAERRNELRTRNMVLAVRGDILDNMLKNKITVSELHSHRKYYEDEEIRGAVGIHQGKRRKYEYEGVFAPMDNHTFVFGGDYQRESADGSYSTASRNYEKTANNTGLYLNYQVELLDKNLNLTLGARQDDHQAFGNETTYRATASYTVPDWSTRFHTSYGTAFNAPNLYKLYGRYGNADLKPEEMRSVDFGIEQGFYSDRVVLDVTGFKNNLTNEITTYNPGTGTQYFNLESTRVFGVETSLKFDITNKLDLTANYTYQQSRYNGGQSTKIATGQVLPNRPTHLFNATLNYAPEAVADLKTWVSMDAASSHFDSSSPIKDIYGGYTVWNLGAEYQFLDNVSVYGRIENLFDKMYSTKSEYNHAGLSGYMGLRANF